MCFFTQGTANSDVSYLATGDNTALEYFAVDSFTGDVSVKKSLLADDKRAKTYRVRYSDRVRAKLRNTTDQTD